MKLVQDGMVHMARIAVYASAHTNGVAAIHTEILKDSVLKDWYQVYPERFQNKTNGITQRRWLALCNPELSGLLTELLGSDDWKIHLDDLKQLERLSLIHIFAPDNVLVIRRCQIALLFQPLEINEIGISGVDGKGLVRGIAVAGRRQRQDLPHLHTAGLRGHRCV